MGGTRLFRLHDDEGMTLVEILVASVIMFIILTAVLGLVAQTTAMGMQAKRKTMLTNAVSAYVERVQGLPFEQVGVDGVDASGTLEPLYTYVDPNRAEFTITIVPDVEWVESEPLKMLNMDVTLTDARGTVVETMQTSVAIRDRAQYLQQASRDPATDPMVRFASPTPPEGSVVWGELWSEGTLRLGLEAEAQAERTLESIQVWCDDQWLLEDSFEHRAQWGVHPQTTWSDNSFIWDTLQEEDVVQPDNSTVPTAIIPDGMRTLSVYALDSAGVSVFAIRHLLVDNYAPSNPGAPLAAVRSASLTDLSWPEAMDGTTPADHYRLAPYRLRAATDPVSPAWTPVSMTDPTSVGPAAAFSTAPFSRYWVSVRAESPRNLASPYAGPVIFSSRPLVTGTYSVSQRVSGTTSYYKTTLDLAVTPPTFATHAAPDYTWNWVYANGTKGKVTNTSPTYTLVGAEHAAAAQPVSVWVDVEYKPYDLASNVKVAISSNLTQPTPSSGSGTLGEGTW